MDSASAAELREFLVNNKARMEHQEEQRAATGHAVQTLAAQVSELTNQLQQFHVPTAQSTLPVLPTPPRGDRQHEPRSPSPEVYACESNFVERF